MNTPLAQLAQYIVDAYHIAYFLAAYTLTAIVGINPFED